MTPDDAFRELVALSEKMGLYDGPQVRVCLTHGKVNVCRKQDGCVWSEGPADVAHVTGRTAG
jgi:hypothetical protein